MSDVETPAQIDEAFDAIAYEKGAAVLRMIESYVGADTFRQRRQRVPAGARLRERDVRGLLEGDRGDVGQAGRAHPADVRQPAGRAADRRLDLSCDGQPDETRATLDAAAFHPRSATRPPAAGRWQIPVCVKAPGRDAADLRCHLLTDVRQTVPVAQRLRAVGLRQRRRAAATTGRPTPPAMLRAMAPHVADRADRARAAVARRRRVGAGAGGPPQRGRLPDAGAGFGREHTSGVLAEVTDRLALHPRLPDDGPTARRDSRRSSDRCCGRSFDELGFAAAAVGRRRSPGAARGRRRRRSARPATIRTSSRRRVAALDRALAGGRAARADGCRGGHVRSAAGARRREAVRRARGRGRTGRPIRRSTTATLYALADVPRSRAHRSRRCRCALSPQLAQPGRGALPGAVSSATRRRAPRAWTFVKDHWTALEPKVAIFGGDTNLVAALGAFCDAQARDDIKAFFARAPAARRGAHARSDARADRQLHRDPQARRRRTSRAGSRHVSRRQPVGPPKGGPHVCSFREVSSYRGVRLQPDLHAPGRRRIP